MAATPGTTGATTSQSNTINEQFPAVANPVHNAQANGIEPPLDAPNQGIGFDFRHVRGIVMNESVSIILYTRGWIIATAVAVARFMAKVTGSQIVIEYLHRPPQQ